jgi:hypothetical protein
MGSGLIFGIIASLLLLVAMLVLILLPILVLCSGTGRTATTIFVLTAAAISTAPGKNRGC